MCLNCIVGKLSVVAGKEIDTDCVYIALMTSE
jgi:hypothetical protein